MTTDVCQTKRKVGVLAGGGDLPRLLVSACQAEGRGVYVLAITDHADPSWLAPYSHGWVRLGALGEAFRLLKQAGVSDVVFAGSIRRPSLANLRPDVRGAAFLARLGGKALGDDGLLRAVAAEFEKEGLHLRGAHEILHNILAKEGQYGSIAPDALALSDIDRGIDVAKGVGALDVGQGAVVQQGIVLAVEAVEGTDAMLARSGPLRRDGAGGVLVKVCKPRQDRRLDLPTIGVHTVEAAASAGLRGIAVEAGSALVLDAHAVAERADALGLFVIGVPQASNIPLIYLIAGEPSGDLLGARLMKALKERTQGQVRFAGVGGESMAEEGLNSLFAQSDIAVMGLAEVIPKIPTVLRRVKTVVKDIESRKPAVVVTIDSLGFNGRVAKSLIAKKNLTPRVHYVAPMVWAWKPKRAEVVAAEFNHLLCLLSFEPPYFEKHGLPTTFVGHPVIESGAGRGDGADFRRRHDLAEDTPVICVLPGSRHNEVTRMLPVFRQAVEIMSRSFLGLRVVIPTVATVADHVRAAVRDWPGSPIVVRGEAERWNAFAACQGAMATSGTVSLELARAGVPFVIGYRAAPLSAWLARRLISIRYATLLNHVADRQVVPEFLQQDCTPQALAEALSTFLHDPNQRQILLQDIDTALMAIVGPYERPSLIAADTVLKVSGLTIALPAHPSHMVEARQSNDDLDKDTP